MFHTLLVPTKTYECVMLFRFHQLAALIKMKRSVPLHSIGNVHQTGGHLEVLF